MTAVDIKILEEYKTCLPPCNTPFFLELYSQDVIQIITDFYNLMDIVKGETTQDAEIEAFASLLSACERIEIDMRDMVEAGCITEIPDAKRQFYAIVSMVKAYLRMKYVEGTTLEDIIKILDLAYLIGRPLRYWDVPKAIDIVLAGIPSQNYSMDKRRLSYHVGKDDAFSSCLLGFLASDHETIIKEDDLPVQIFIRTYFKKNIPVKVSEGMTSWAALIKWKYVAYLRRLTGHRTVPIEMGDYSRFGRVRFTTVGEYLDDLCAGKKVEECGYLAQHQLFDQEPRLSNDINVPDFCNVTSDEIISHIWLGPAKTLSRLHNDPCHNILAQVVGRKMVTLISPAYTEYVYPNVDRFTNTSMVDVREPDFERFPNFQKVRAIMCVLYPGEMVFIPKGWWHAVEAIDISFSVNFFF